MQLAFDILALPSDTAVSTCPDVLSCAYSKCCSYALIQSLRGGAGYTTVVTATARASAFRIYSEDSEVYGARNSQQEVLMSAPLITNRDLLLVRLLAHFLLLYLWMPSPVLFAVKNFITNLKAVFPSSVLELQVLWRCAVIAVNHRIADTCSEDTTSQWMRHLIVAPSLTYTVWLAVTGGH